jgi:hypothetical protein
MTARARVAVVLAWIAFIGVLAEGTSRVFWRTQYGISMRDTRRTTQAFYGELAEVTSARPVPSRNDTTIDVLLLGGSTINPQFGAIGQSLVEQLTRLAQRPVRVFNLGVPAQTSLDSFYKYRALTQARFDAVAIYDGFNEVRANNAPPGMFRDDYSHYAYYELLKDLVDRQRLWPLATPFTVRHLIRSARETSASRSGGLARVPRHTPDSTWTRYGANLRTPSAFRRNLTTILDSAAARGDPVVLMTYATYFAPGYTADAFRKKRLDYTAHTMAIEVWGRPDHVRAGIASHNAVIRTLHAERPSSGFVDMEAAIPRDGRFFNDVCHFTIEGSQRFAGLLAAEILRVSRERPEGR